ncbi:MAG: hypothetical protein KBE04_13420 [Phycisphaerae bacterium]|nr:hypothetical protein [Phycisphaerae bacterium]
MARYRSPKPLYEVIRQARLKAPEPGSVAPLRPAPSEDPVPDTTVQKAEEHPAEPTPPAQAVRWQHPRPVQFNAGRLELTVPYPIAAAIALAILLIVLAAYRLGQSNAPAAPAVAPEPAAATG